MGQLVKNMNRHDVQWWKLKGDYMYNNTYYLRKKKFIVYQFATNIIGAANSIGFAVLKRTTSNHFPFANLLLNVFLFFSLQRSSITQIIRLSLCSYQLYRSGR